VTEREATESPASVTDVNDIEMQQVADDVRILYSGVRAALLCRIDGLALVGLGGQAGDGL
jgi:hypothetical protein